MDYSEMNEWCAYLRSRGRKDRTIRTYASNVRRCLLQLASHGRPYRAADITEDSIYFLKDTLPVREWTVREMLHNLDRMILWRTGRSILDGMSILWNRTIRQRTYFSRDEFERMYALADPPERLVLVLGAMMGLRRSEIVGIRLEDIGETDILIHGKGHGTDGLVVRQPMPPEAKEEIREYRRWRDPRVPPRERHLLIMTTRTGRICRQDTGKRVSDAMSELAAKAGAHGSTHTLRRLYGTTVYRVSGEDIVVTKQLLRHANVSTTIQCYIEPNFEKAREVVLDIGQAFRI